MVGCRCASPDHRTRGEVVGIRAAGDHAVRPVLATRISWPTGICYTRAKTAWSLDANLYSCADREPSPPGGLHALHAGNRTGCRRDTISTIERLRTREPCDMGGGNRATEVSSPHTQGPVDTPLGSVSHCLGSFTNKLVVAVKDREATRSSAAQSAKEYRASRPHCGLGSAPGARKVRT